MAARMRCVTMATRVATTEGIDLPFDFRPGSARSQVKITYLYLLVYVDQLKLTRELNCFIYIYGVSWTRHRETTRKMTSWVDDKCQEMVLTRIDGCRTSVLPNKSFETFGWQIQTG